MKKVFLLLICLAAAAPLRAQMLDKVVLYLPNRILDVMDIFTMNIGVGPVASAEVHATHGFRCGAGVGYTAMLVKDFNRQYGVALKNGSFGFLGAGFEDMERRGDNALVPDYWEHITGVPTPDEKIFDRRNGSRDYYDIGGMLGPGILEFEFTLHPVEMLDLFLGFFFVDIRDDDLTFEMFR